MLKKAFISIMVTLAIIKDCNILPKYLNIFLHFLVGTVAFASDVLVYKFYGHLPDFKKSVLTYTVRLMVVASGIAVVWYNLAAIILQFSSYLSKWVAEYPNMFCTLLRAETVCEVIIVATIMIQLCKACIVFNSMYFLSMDHERVFKVILILVLIIFVTHNSLALILAGTLCPAPKLSRILNLNRIEVDEEMKKAAPPLFFVYLFVAFLATMILKLVKKFRNRKERKYPIVPKNLTTVSGIPRNNTIHPLNTNPTARAAERSGQSQSGSNAERETAATEQNISTTQNTGDILHPKCWYYSPNPKLLK